MSGFSTISPERKEQESRLAYQATHDALTGLGNRALFNDRLEHDFSLARRRCNLLAVLFIDLDEFKPINDTLGHKVGDELLVSVTARLSATLRPSDTLARLGGDEFVLLLRISKPAMKRRRSPSACWLSWPVRTGLQGRSCTSPQA